MAVKNISSKIGLYIHIPYCLQKCPYCDFAKYEVGEIPPYTEYISLLKKEITVKASLLKNKSVQTLYLGGGTPSLLPPQVIADLKSHLDIYFDFTGLEEFTLECNPGTLTPASLKELKSIGINRFSVGAQTFNPDVLKILGRRHSVQETLDTLNLLEEHHCPYTLDLMYALPKQTLEDFKSDITTALQFSPKHISLYYLTLPEKHALNINRPSEDTQIQMFDSLEEELLKKGIYRYEISNFSVPGHESKHNTVYWTDQEYIGFGIGAHSYLKLYDYGVRFWNARTYPAFETYVQKITKEPLLCVHDNLPAQNVEILKVHESLTDFCHTSLRRMEGFDLKKFNTKYPKLESFILSKLEDLTQKGLLQKQAPTNFSLTKEGKRLTNLVFEKLTFLSDDIRLS